MTRDHTYPAPNFRTPSSRLHHQCVTKLTQEYVQGHARRARRPDRPGRGGGRARRLPGRRDLPARPPASTPASTAAGRPRQRRSDATRSSSASTSRRVKSFLSQISKDGVASEAFVLGSAAEPPVQPGSFAFLAPIRPFLRTRHGGSLRGRGRAAGRAAVRGACARPRGTPWCGRPSEVVAGVLGSSWGSWQAVTPMRSPGREGCEGKASQGRREFGLPWERRHRDGRRSDFRDDRVGEPPHLGRIGHEDAGNVTPPGA